jgi:predicted RNase H-like nuclease (RuvC/YqgF family)
MEPSPELQTKLQSCELEIQQYVRELQTENAKLHLRMVKLEVKNVSYESRVAAQKEELRIYTKPMSDADHNKFAVERLQERLAGRKTEPAAAP